MRRRPFACRALRRFLPVAGIAIPVVLSAGMPARATPAMTMDLTTGEVLYQQEATRPWFPASTTKLMTVYVALSAVRDGKIAMNTPIVYSARARTMPPSKMGFRPGTQVTLENALKMLMVKSANDIAVTVAEGVSGSVEAFADDMNQAAASLGLRESHFVNPNGLPNPDHVSSVRDMALIARALYTQFPQEAPLFDIGVLQVGPEIIANHNNLLGRYPGADGMKTGFTCAAGFNVVASAFRDGRRIVTIVFGAPSVATRTEKAAALFDRAFGNVDRPTASILSLPDTGGSAPDMHNAVCRNRAPLIATFNAEVEQLDAALLPPTGGIGLPSLNLEHNALFGSSNLPAGAPMATHINQIRPEPSEPVQAHIGADPGYNGPVAQAREPHSPIGTETVPSTAEAYAPAGQPDMQGVGIAPLAADPRALPLRGRRAKVASRGRRGRAGALTAAAEAPKTKVLAGADDDEHAEGKSKAVAKSKPAGTASARKPVKASAAKPAAHAAVKPGPKAAATKKTKSADNE